MTLGELNRGSELLAGPGFCNHRRRGNLRLPIVASTDRSAFSGRPFEVVPVAPARGARLSSVGVGPSPRACRA